MLLRDQVALVTGGGRGIGRAIAERFASQGASVVVVARTAEQVLATVQAVQQQGGCAEGVVTDLSQEAGCLHAVEQARKRFGPVDILVNNAGIFGPVKSVEEITAAEWDQVMAINLRAPFLLSRLVLPEMYRRHGGNILNIASVAAKTALTWNGAYATSKAGLLALTRSLAAEGAAFGVRANAICAGPVPETKLSQELGRGIAQRVGGDPDDNLRRFLERFLQRQPQTVAEIAAAALFLVSKESRPITGQSVNVDGGLNFY